MFYVHEVRNLLRASNFRNASGAGWVRIFQGLVSWAEAAVYFAMFGLSPGKQTSEGRHVRSGQNAKNPAGANLARYVPVSGPL